MSDAMLPFDTLNYANRLKAAGVPSTQAEAQAFALAEVFESHALRLATQADIRELRGELRGELRELELRLRAELAVLKWTLGVIVAGIVTLVGKAFL